VTPDELLAWERRLESWEADLTRRTDGINDLATSLPAAPVRGLLLHLLEDRQVADLDTQELAKGLGLEHQFVLDVLSGERQSLDVREIAATCEALHASPFDVWEPGDARRIVGAYGPEHWPRYIEPIDDIYDPEPSEFMLGRADQLAKDLVAVASATEGIRATELRVVVTPYRHAGIVAVGPDGRAEPVSDLTAPAAKDTDYFFTFEQIRRPMEVDVVTEDPYLPAIAPPGEDAPCSLVSIAEGLRGWTTDLSMVRFTDPATGDEHWLGRDPSSDTWVTWADPTDGYPGPPDHVLRVGHQLAPELLLDDRRPRLDLDDGNSEPPGPDIL
jgi:hypothetical protein